MIRPVSWIIIVIISHICLFSGACSNNADRLGPDGSTDSDSDSTTDTDSGTDTDADTDSDTDTDSDNDSDTDTDADTDADTDTDTGEEQFDHIYDVGPGQPYADPSEVPWESLEPSTLVRVHHRLEPYANKWVINTVGTADKPVVVRGIDSSGRMPVITGVSATTRQELDYWNEKRSVIKVGGSSIPNEDVMPSYIHIENLEIRGGRPPYQFTDHEGNTDTYADNAAAIHVETGEHIAIRGCILNDSGNGFFAGHQCSDLLLEGNYIYDNGIEDSIYHHNNYTEVFGITFQYNRFGPLRAGCLGNNLKDRSAGTVIRYNWIESGNRQLDLVESDYDEFVNHPSYTETFVYGNILVEPEDAGNSQLMHYGGDGDDQSMYRRGILYLYNNTFVSFRSGNTTIIRLSTNDVRADIRNNIVHTEASGDHLAICNGTGIIDLTGNWFSSGWRDTHESSMDGTMSDHDNLEGASPGFDDLNQHQFALSVGSPCLNTASSLNSNVLPDHDVTRQYSIHQKGEARPINGSLDIGAFERP